MSWFLIVPLIVGTVTVLQGTFNQSMSNSMGLGWALVINSILTLVFSIMLYLAAKWWPNTIPAMFQGTLDIKDLAWWMVLPGVFGMCIIAGIPWAISKLGATKVFVAIVVAQIVVSLLWDIFVEKKPVSMLRMSGAALAVVGVVLASLEQGSLISSRTTLVFSGRKVYAH